MYRQCPVKTLSFDAGGLGHHPLRLRPALARLIGEFFENPRGLARLLILPGGLRQFRDDLRPQAIILGQPQDEIHLVRLAPRHQRFPAETGIAAHDNPHRRPRPPKLLPQAGHFLHAPRRPIAIRRAQRAPSRRSPQKMYNGR